MKKTLFRAMLIIMGAAAVMGCDKQNQGTPDIAEDSANGVWEGPMTIDEAGNTTVEIINIKNGEIAEFYEMGYTLENGYEVKDKETSAIGILSGDKNSLTSFVVTIDGNTVTFTREGNSLVCEAGTPTAGVSADSGEEEENLTVYNRNGYDISHYKNVKLSPSLLPTDEEYAGPSKLSVSLKSTGNVEMLTAGIDWMELLVWAGKTAATTAWGKGVGVLLDMLFPATEDTRLDTILEKIDAISEQLAQMTILYHNTTYESYLNQRSKMISELENCNSVYFTRLSKVNTEDEAQAEAEVKVIVLDWAKNTVGGNPVWAQGFNYIDFLLKTVVEQKDIFNMYDLYTYNTTPWENMGYAIREGLRASDIAIAAQTLYLTQLYHKVREDLDDASLEKILSDNIAKFNTFSEYIMSRPVEHHDDKGICQIYGAHFVMESYPLDYPQYRNPSWSTIPCRWTSDSYGYFMWGPNQAENYNKALKPEEVECIMNYYAGSDRSLGDIFKEDANIKLGAKIVTSNFNGVVPLQGGSYSQGNNVGVDKAIFLNTAKTADDIKPLACGEAHCEMKYEYIVVPRLYLVGWYTFNDDYNWVRTNVIER